MVLIFYQTDGRAITRKIAAECVDTVCASFELCYLSTAKFLKTKQEFYDLARALRVRARLFRLKPTRLPSLLSTSQFQNGYMKTVLLSVFFTKYLMISVLNVCILLLHCSHQKWGRGSGVLPLHNFYLKHLILIFISWQIVPII